jgi:hypothetical protein
MPLSCLTKSDGAGQSPIFPSDSVADPCTSRFLKNLKLVVVDELHYYHDMLGRCVRTRVPHILLPTDILQPRCIGNEADEKNMCRSGQSVDVISSSNSALTSGSKTAASDLSHAARLSQDPAST